MFFALSLEEVNWQSGRHFEEVDEDWGLVGIEKLMVFVSFMSLADDSRKLCCFVHYSRKLHGTDASHQLKSECRWHIIRLLNRL